MILLGKNRLKTDTYNTDKQTVVFTPYLLFCVLPGTHTHEPFSPFVANLIARSTRLTFFRRYDRDIGDRVGCEATSLLSCDEDDVLPPEGHESLEDAFDI